MHVVEGGKSEKKGAWKKLEPAAGVSCAVAEKPAPHGIGEPRCLPFRPSVAPILPFAGEKQKGRGRRLRGKPPQARDIGGIVLAVAVEGRDPLRARPFDPREDSGALAAAFLVAKKAQLRHLAAKAGDLCGGAVAASVIDIKDLVSQHAVEHCAYLVDERSDIRLFVPDRNDDGKIHETAAAALQFLDKNNERALSIRLKLCAVDLACLPPEDKAASIAAQARSR